MSALFAMTKGNISGMLQVEISTFKTSGFPLIIIWHLPSGLWHVLVISQLITPGSECVRTWVMKMPERSRTSRIVNSTVLWPQSLLYDIMWCHIIILWRSHDVMMSYYGVTPQTIMILYGNSYHTKACKLHFLTSWPWPLTYYLIKISSRSISIPILHLWVIWFSDESSE